MSINVREFFIRLSGFWFLHRWHPEVALRYIPVVRELKKLGKKISVLDVGSGGLGIAPYLGRKVTGLDVSFAPPFDPNLNRVQASALNVPFKNNSFDAVVSVDTLEHMNQNDRKQAIRELVRVAKRIVIIAVPVGSEAQSQDEELDHEYVKRYNKRFHFLEEQIDFRLPKEEEIIRAVEQSSDIIHKHVTIKVNDNENLQLRKYLMQGWMSNNLLANLYFRKLLLLLLPIFLLFNQKPVYRKIFIINIV